MAECPLPDLQGAAGRDILGTIERCWWSGMSLASTRATIKRHFAVAIDAETIRREFVRICDAFVGAAHG